MIEIGPQSGGSTPANIASETFTPRDNLPLSCGRGSGAIRSRIFLHPLAQVPEKSPRERVQPDHVSVPVASRNGAPTDGHDQPDFQAKIVSRG